jgi:hypothetical protein
MYYMHQHKSILCLLFYLLLWAAAEEWKEERAITAAGILAGIAKADQRASEDEIRLGLRVMIWSAPVI